MQTAELTTAAKGAAVADVKLYWIPGCGNCTRLKGYLGANEVPYEAVNVLEDPQVQQEIRRQGISSMPVLRKGDAWIIGLDLKKVDALLGLSGTAAGEAKTIPPLEATRRVAAMLEVAAQAASLIPAEHHDDPTPTMNDFTKAIMFRRDGTPHIPHHSTRSLVGHLTGHAHKLWRVLLAHDGTYELGYDNEKGDHKGVVDGESTAFGEPDLHMPLYRVILQLELAARDIRAWGKANPNPDLTRSFLLHGTEYTAAQLMQINLCSVAQHTRQVLQVVEAQGLTPPKTIDPADLDGLQMSPGVWQ